MELEIKVSINQIVADCSTATYIDNTGDYNSPDNEGGYGSPNKDRINLAAFLVVFMYSEGEDDTRLVVDNSTSVVADNWTVDISSDGYIYASLLLIDIYSPTSGVYAVDAIVYENGIYYKALVANDFNSPIPPSTNATIWEVVIDPYEEITNIQSDQVGTDDDLLSCRSEICYAAEVARIASGSCCQACQNGKFYIKLDVLLQGALTLCDRNLFTQADKVIRQMQSLCDSIDCETCNPTRFK